MKVLIDADGCPVVNETIILCRQYQIDCMILCDTAHEFHRDGAQTLVFDKGSDSVDYAIVNRVCPGDIVITQDYGLAAMCLSRNATVLHQDGWEYTKDTIDGLLLIRHDARKHRAAGGRVKGPKKRTHHQNQAFSSALASFLDKAVQG